VTGNKYFVAEMLLMMAAISCVTLGIASIV